MARTDGRLGLKLTGGRFPAGPATRWAALAAVVVVAGGAAWMWRGGGSALAGDPVAGFAASMLGGSAVALSEPLRRLQADGPWLNSPPLGLDQLRRKVVVVNFWTYSCINSLRPLPYLRSWAGKYGDHGLVVIGVHTPEFAFERDVGNVRRAVAEQGVSYPVVLDSDYGIWNRYLNNAWPAFYFIDARGRVRRQALGEGDYDKAEKLIQTLLTEAHGAPVGEPITPVSGTGIQAAADWGDIASEETYIGYGKAQAFDSPGGLRRNLVAVYAPPGQLPLNHWSLTGSWQVGEEFATATAPAAKLAFRFHARDLNLVMGPPPGGQVRYRVRIDGQEPGADHGVDVDAQGRGEVREPRLYQLVRQQGGVRDRTFEIEFLDPGARGYVFTFG